MGFNSTGGGAVCFIGDEANAGDGSIEVTGTDGSVASGSSIVFKSASDSNVVVNVSEGANGEVVVEVGVYYA